jgi:hypothetical protein
MKYSNRQRKIEYIYIQYIFIYISSKQKIDLSLFSLIII